MKNLSDNKPVIFISPYLVIAIAAVVAYLPVSSMMLALKNDVIAIEYPIQHFLSESLRNSESPVWFNTWGMGFPLQSILSWSFFSTPQTLISLVFKSSVYVLHAEFMLYIMSAGWVMYFFLKKHFFADKHLALLLSCCYMLSGFTVASSQWLLYITGMTFIPLVISALISLLKKPSPKNSVLFAVFYYLLLTNVHIYLTIITSYLVFFIFLFYLCSVLFVNKNIASAEKIKLLKFVTLAGIFTTILCIAPLYYSAELISYLNRSTPISNNHSFFESNYLHPAALTSLFLPLSSVKATFSNTEGVLLNSYMGLLPLILFPSSLIFILKKKNSQAAALLVTSLLFLAISFGYMTPLREWLNILPGLSYFRNSGVLRFFFILFFIFYLASAFRDHSLPAIADKHFPGRKIFIVTIVLLGLYFLLLFINNSALFSGLNKGSLYESFKNAGKKELILFNALIQLFFILLIFFSFLKNKYLLPLIIITELIINTLICTPYFTVSTYSVKEVQQILKSPEGFPMQDIAPYKVSAKLIDEKGNTWHNINTFRKEVSNEISITGPLILHEVAGFLEDNKKKKIFIEKGIVFMADTALNESESIRVIQQKPNKVVASLDLISAKDIILQQSFFPGWKAYYNGKKIHISEKGKPFVSVYAPSGSGTLIFVFEKKWMIVFSALLHLMIIFSCTFLIWKSIIKSRIHFQRKSV